ncbi:MAG: hypothetical protein IJ928_08770, partial [Prevotella sp.]|nr:hypothetical protein [Prevotella sp.]
AQQTAYKTFVYTSDELANEISRMNGERDASRGYLGDLFNATKGSAKGIASGYVTSFFDLGINAVGALLTQNSRRKAQWEEVVKKENVYQTVINSVSEMNDFYDDTSFDGAMDPKGMRFDGIGCLRTEGRDTMFYISCHIDRTKLHRIINHSKFELVLDTLIVSPEHSNLPNTQLAIPFSFKDRKNFTLSMDIAITSSWMNEIVQLQQNQELGRFNINIPVDQKMLDGKGFFRYVRHGDDAPRYKVTGECFIVPRSYMGFRDDKDNFKDCWGTGEYKLSITIKETCDVTEQYRAQWKEDYKHRKQLAKAGKKNNLIEQSWQMISTQKWDELAQSWVITTLKAPVSKISSDVINGLGLDD